MSKVDIARNMALFALTLALGACGGIHRSYLVADRQDAEGLIDATDQVSRARGYETRTREGRVVKLVFDRGTGSRMAFSLRRNGVLLTVSVDEERVAPSDVEAELARVEAAGRELLALARVEAAEVARVQALRAEEEAAAERARAAQAQQESADREADGARLRAFMDQNQARHDAFRARNDPPAASAAPTQAPGQGGGGSGHCCVNGAFYDCPDPAAVDRCVGAFTRCLSGCGMTCVEECMQSSPPDPSGCRRDSARDGEC